MKQQICDVLRRFLPQSMRRRVFNLGFNIAPEQFKEFSYLYANAPNMERGLMHLSRRGLIVRKVLDIGAFEGNFGRMVNRVWPEANIMMIEANEEKRPILEKAAKETGATVNIALLGPEDGKVVGTRRRQGGRLFCNGVWVVCA